MSLNNATRPSKNCKQPTMIIMMAANKMNPTAQPLVSFSPLARPAAAGYASSVICRPSSALPAGTSGRLIRVTDCTVPLSQGEGIIHLG